MTMHMTRRSVLARTCGLLAAPAIISPRSRALAATTLTLAHGAAPSNPRSVAAKRFAELVAAKTGGRVAVNVAGSEQLGSDAAVLMSLRTGAIDVSVNSQGTSSNLVPEVGALGLPFIFADSEEAFRVLDGPVGEELGKKFEALGIMVLGWWDNGIRHVTNSRLAITRPEDLRGLKIRTPADPMTIDIFRALGAATEQISFSELYVALQQGVVDGQENPLANIASAKIYEVNPYISLTAHKWESNPFLMSQIAWNRLGQDNLEAVKAAAREAGELQRQLMRDANAKYLAEFKANPRLKVNEIDRAPFEATTAPVVEAWRRKPFGEFVTRVVRAAQS
jgi:tripartite ATP-independent transporter DctP family solute receptor